MEYKLYPNDPYNLVQQRFFFSDKYEFFRELYQVPGTWYILSDVRTYSFVVLVGKVKGCGILLATREGSVF